MSKFDDDMARGCLPTGEPLECLYGVGWWTERDEPEPDPYDLHIAELESRIAELEAVQRWILVGERLPEEDEMSVSEHANYLLNEYGRLQFDYAAYCKPYGESLRNEARNNLEEYIAELEAMVERLIEAGNKLGTYFIGYTPRKKELLQREFWEAWRSAVSDWQSMTSHVTNPSDSQGIVTRNGGEG